MRVLRQGVWSVLEMRQGGGEAEPLCEHMLRAYGCEFLLFFHFHVKHAS